MGSGGRFPRARVHPPLNPTFPTLMLLLLIAFTRAQQSEGDGCMTRDGAFGICRPVSKCAWALEVIKHRSVPDICSFRGDTAIVCCAHGEGVPQAPPTQPPRQRPPPPRPIVGLGEEEEEDGQDYGYDPIARPRPGQRPQQPPWGGDARPQPAAKEAGRLARDKCQKYTADVTQTIAALPLVPKPKPVQVRVPNCDISRLPLIVGGENAELGEFPHMAAIGFSTSSGISWNCGGSLISENFVLTAAHCTTSSLGPPVRVRLGELNLKSDADGATPLDVDVVEVIAHPKYKPPAKYHDIALLRLAERPLFSKVLRPACIYTREQFPPSVNKTIATGWGRIAYAESPSDNLLKVALDIIDNSLCNELWRSATGTKQLSSGIAPTMICAGVLKGGKDTCQGDSGGPIQIPSPDNKCVYQVIGVTSFGKACAAENSPGVYTRVASYVPWIESVVWPNEAN